MLAVVEPEAAGVVAVAVVEPVRRRPVDLEVVAEAAARLRVEAEVGEVGEVAVLTDADSGQAARRPCSIIGLRTACLEAFLTSAAAGTAGPAVRIS